MSISGRRARFRCAVVRAAGQRARAQRRIRAADAARTQMILVTSACIERPVLERPAPGDGACGTTACSSSSEYSYRGDVCMHEFLLVHDLRREGRVRGCKRWRDSMMNENERALFAAAYGNDVEALAREIRAGADPNAQHPPAGTVPLQLACEANALDAIRFLLENGANPSLSFSRQSRVDGRWFLNWTPLMFALSVEAADLMVHAGADLEAQDGQGWTALVHAIRGKDVPLVSFFLEHGASTAVQPRLSDRLMNLLEFLEDDVTFLTGLPASAVIEQRLDALATIRGLLEKRVNSL